MRRLVFIGFLVLFCGLFISCEKTQNGIDKDIALEGIDHVFDDDRNFFWIDVVDITSVMNLVAEWQGLWENKDKIIISFSPTQWNQKQNGWLFLYKKGE